MIEKQLSWQEFKNEISKNNPTNRFFYRGQEDSSFALTTTLQRTGMKVDKRILELYQTILNFHQGRVPRRLPDIPTGKSRLEQLIENFNTKTDVAILSVSSYFQHYGFPSPLLDWTISPDIASYFAFRNINKTITDQDAVSVYAFDVEEWMKNIPEPSANLMSEHEVFYPVILKDDSYNSRIQKQKGKHIFSSVENIEQFVTAKEKQFDRQFLVKYSIDVEERPEVIKELDNKGISECTLFEGEDAFMRTLKERVFVLHTFSSRKLALEALEQTMNKELK